MTLLVRTARIGGYRGADALDITRKSGKPGEGLPFAPSWEQGAVSAQDWAAYTEAYKAEMRLSYRRNRAAWDALLQRPLVTLLCYCTNPTRCHRTLLAGILVKLGAQLHPDWLETAVIEEPAQAVALLRAVFGDEVLIRTEQEVSNAAR